MRVKIPATTANIGPGFDCLGMALSLYNTIEFEQLPENGIYQLSAQGESADEVSLNEDNLVYQVYKQTLLAAHAPVYGVKMHFDNQIPFARGLGSSSAAIIGGAMVANTFLNGRLSNEEILSIAMTFEGHPDNIAPALLGGAVLSGIRDDNTIFYQKITPPKSLHCTLIVPDYPLETAKAREVLPKTVSMSDAVYNISRTALLIDGLHRGDVAQIAQAMTDKLHQPYREPLIKGMKTISQKAAEAGALATVISGAGPTLLLVSDYELPAEKIAPVLQQLAINGRILSLKPSLVGAEVN